MSKRKKSDIIAIEKEYKSLIPVADRFCKEVKNQLEKILVDSEIKLGFPIQNRIKLWESLSKKLDRIPLEIDSVNEIQDLVGFRLILLFKGDIEKVVKALSKYFSIVRQYDTQERLKENQFGYSSVHVIIKLPNEWLSVPTFRGMDDLQAEIQIRTLAQHIWAEASHVLQYKQEESVPSEVLRAIYRVSALLETVDLELERVLEQRVSYRATINVSSNEPSELNVDLLEETLNVLLPSMSKTYDEDYSELLEELIHFGIKNLQELKAFVQSGLEKALDADREQAKKELREYQKEEVLWTERPPEILLQGIFYNHSGLIRQMIKQRFGDKALMEYWGEKQLLHSQTKQEFD